jgi:SPP1 family predicted phage head-tail adaptor
MSIESFNRRIEVWGYNKTTNEIGELDQEPSIIKTIWARIIPQTGSLKQQEGNTILSNVTHKIKIRYSSGKDITQNMWIMYKGNRFDIKYILNPYYSNEFLEIFCTEVIE